MAQASARSERPSATVHQPLVSVCMAAFNVEPFLGAAVRSVLGQTYANFELLLIDDGSTDRSWEVASSFSDPRIRLSRAETNLGGFPALNRVAAAARGEFLAFYHADDVYEPTIVAKEVEYLQTHPDVGAVFSRDYNIDEGGRIYAVIPLPREFVGRMPLDYDTVLRYQVRRRNPFCSPTFMTRRTVFDAVGGFEYEPWRIAADFEMWLRIARRFPLAILDEPLVRYRKGRQQSTWRYRRLRTDPDLFFAIVDDALARPGGRERLTPDDLTEYAFHRCDDDTFRAANFIIKGDPASARHLLRNGPFPWRTLRAGVERRKLRLLALRALLSAGLAAGASRWLARALRYVGP